MSIKDLSDLDFNTMYSETLSKMLWSSKDKQKKFIKAAEDEALGIHEKNYCNDEYNPKPTREKIYKVLEIVKNNAK